MIGVNMIDRYALSSVTRVFAISHSLPTGIFPLPRWGKNPYMPAPSYNLKKINHFLSTRQEYEISEAQTQLSIV